MATFSVQSEISSSNHFLLTTTNNKPQSQSSPINTKQIHTRSHTRPLSLVVKSIEPCRTIRTRKLTFLLLTCSSETYLHDFTSLIEQLDKDCDWADAVCELDGNAAKFLADPYQRVKILVQKKSA